MYSVIKTKSTWLNSGFFYSGFSLSLLLIISSCAQQAIKSPDEHSASPAVSNVKVSKSAKENYRDAITALYNNDLSGAQRLFTEFIRNNPELAGGYANMGLVYYKKGDLVKSLNQVNKAIKLNPKQVHALNIRGQIHVKNGKINEAKEDYIKAITVKPAYANAQYNLALLYDIYLQDIKLAIKHYKIYLSLLKIPDEATQEWVTHLEGTLKNG